MGKTYALVSLFSLIVLAGCGKMNKATADWGRGYTEMCIHGVGYLQFPSGASVEYDKNGQILRCSP